MKIYRRYELKDAPSGHYWRGLITQHKNFKEVNWSAVVLVHTETEPKYIKFNLDIATDFGTDNYAYTGPIPYPPMRIAGEQL